MGQKNWRNCFSPLFLSLKTNIQLTLRVYVWRGDAMMDHPPLNYLPGHKPKQQNKTKQKKMGKNILRFSFFPFFFFLVNSNQLVCV